MQLLDWIMVGVSFFVIYLGMIVYNNAQVDLFNVISVHVGQDHRLIAILFFLIGLWMLYTIYRWNVDLKRLRNKKKVRVKDAFH